MRTPESSISRSSTFRGATNHFADPDFDGDPVQIYAPGDDDPIAPPDDLGEGEGATPELPPRRNCRGSARPAPPAARSARFMSMASAPASWPSGSNISTRTASSSPSPARLHPDGAEKALHQPRGLSEALEDGRTQAGDHRGAGGRGPVARHPRRRARQDARSLRSDLPRRLRSKPLTRRERAESVKKRDVFTKYGPQARAVLDALLDKYRDEGVLNLDDTNVLQSDAIYSDGQRRAARQRLRRQGGLREGRP